MATYTVIENTPGYLPDAEPADFTEYRDAVEYANDLADQLEGEGYRTDRSIASRDNYYAVSAYRNDPYDLGRVIEVVLNDEDDR
jgi:hypothetical protein